MIALLSVAALAPSASAQIGSTVPGPSYFEAVEQIYRAEHRRAVRSLQGEVRSSVKFSVHNRWVDSISFRAMLGEALYQQGLYADALQQLTMALELFESQSAWLTTVSFQQPPRPDPVRGQRLPVWARSSRRVSYCELPRSFLVTIGQIDNSGAAQQGGVVRQAQYWKLDAQEIARGVAWALYRRGKILGPLAKHDPLQARLTERFALGGLGPARHWSNAWVELWWGVAAASRGDHKLAEPHLARATLLDGAHDHALTGLALLVRGEMAMERDDPTAAALLGDAVVAALAYDDYATLDEAVRAVHEQRLAVGDTSPHPLLEPLATAAAREGLSQIAIRASLALSESLIMRGRQQEAQRGLNTLFRRRNDAERSVLGAEAGRLSAIARARSGDSEGAQATAYAALTKRRTASLKNFRVALANDWYDSGLLTPRLAPELFGELIGDPGAMDWVTDPLDTLACLATDHTGALDRWFLSEVAENDAKGALVASEVAKRRRFTRTHTFAGRAATLRRLLEANDAQLEVGQRQVADAIAERWPRYAAAREEGRAARKALEEAEDLFEGPIDPQRRLLIQRLEASLSVREAVITEVAVSRTPTPLAYPPPLDLEVARGRLAEGEAVVAFHEAGGELFGMLLVAEGEDLWSIAKPGRARREVAALLVRLAGVSAQQSWTPETLEDTAWLEASRTLSEMLFSSSRVDFARVKKITIVPDGALWHAPFEALQSVGTNQEGELLIDLAPVRYSPTVATALAPRAPPRPVRNALWVVPSKHETPQGDPLAAALEKSHRYTAGAAISPLVAKSLCEQVVVSHELVLNTGQAHTINLWGGRERGGLADWAQLPYRGPETLVCDNLHTLAERSLKSGRRGAGATEGRAGDEVFQLACASLAPGVRSALWTRWTTRGRVHQDLIAEYLTGLEGLDASESWRRSVRLARPMTLGITREPRIEGAGIAPDEAPDASHPFFWAGYMLVE